MHVGIQYELLKVAENLLCRTKNLGTHIIGLHLEVFYLVKLFQETIYHWKKVILQRVHGYLNGDVHADWPCALILRSP